MTLSPKSHVQPAQVTLGVLSPGTLLAQLDPPVVELCSLMVLPLLEGKSFKNSTMARSRARWRHGRSAANSRSLTATFQTFMCSLYFNLSRFGALEATAGEAFGSAGICTE